MCTVLSPQSANTLRVHSPLTANAHSSFSAVCEYAEFNSRYTLQIYAKFLSLYATTVINNRDRSEESFSRFFKGKVSRDIVFILEV
jgi:hypothetical protein